MKLAICAIVALLFICCTGPSSAARAAQRKIRRKDLLFFSFSNYIKSNKLLAYTPAGKLRYSVTLAGSAKGPLNNDGFPDNGKRLVNQVLPGATSEDGLFSFNPESVNRPKNSNTKDDDGYLIVTNLKTGKVVLRTRVPQPGLAKGTDFNFQADWSPPANQGDVETNLGYAARRYIAAGKGKGNKYPLYLIVSAWSCKSKSNGRPNKQQFLTKYSYDAKRNKVTWAGSRVLLATQCPKEQTPAIPDNYYARALGAAGSDGYLIADVQQGQWELKVYKLVGNKLETQFTKTNKPFQSSCSKYSLQGVSPLRVSAYCEDAPKKNSNLSRRLWLFGSDIVSPISGFTLPSNYFVAATAPGPTAGHIYVSAYNGAAAAKTVQVYSGKFNKRSGKGGVFKKAFKLSASLIGSSSIDVV